MKIRQVGNELFHADGRTDMTKVLGVFQNFANATKNVFMSRALRQTQKFRLFQITNLMQNSFILQQYVCYITLNMFRAARCSSSGGQIVLLQPLVSSPSVNSRTVCRWRADCSPLSTCMLYGRLQRVTIPEAVVIQFVLLRMSRVLLETC